VVSKIGKESNDHSFFHVCTLQSINSTDKLTKFLNEKIDLDKLKLIIVDEAHISIAPTYRNSIECLISKGAKLIGLTATPGRQLKTVNDIDNKTLSEFYFNRLFNLKTPGDNAIDYLRNQGILSNVHFQSIEGSVLDKFLSENEIKHCRENNTIPKKIEQILTNDNRRNAIIFDNLVQLLNQGKKIIFFATSLEHSRLITSLLKLKGFKAEHVDGSTGSYRSKIIRDFRNNELQILCNYGVLSTGFDDPMIDVVFMARPTNSIVLYSQIIGRGLRGPVIGGTDTCEIYTVFDNILDLPENNDIYTYFDEYFEN
jgi:DNA repair protein RadD